jgi:hypothetical protein
MIPEVAHVEITRYFREWNEEQQDPRVRRILRGRPPETTWSTLVAPDAKRLVVLVAPSGSGKSAEMRRQAARLREAGHLGVFADARSVADFGFTQALDEAEADTFRLWQVDTSQRAVIFVDGIDELALSRKDVVGLLQHLAGVLDPQACWQLVLSARTGGWRTWLATLLRKRLLGNSDADAVFEVTFAELDLEAIRQLAAAAGCADVDAFLNAVEADEIDATVQLRPMDVAPLVAGWTRDRRLRGWAQVLDQFVETCVATANPERDMDRRLTPRRARLAARRMGAATVLMKKAFASLPTEASSDATVSARRLFDDWPMDELRELFEVPLFVHKGADTVQLSQGPLPAYLAARWLADRWRGRHDTEWLRDILMVRVYGESSFALPASRRETAGWLASEIPDFRRLLIEDYPETVLYEGDPDRLSDKEIAASLSRVLDRVDCDDRAPIPTAGTLRKLARASVEPEILAMARARLGQPSTEVLFSWAAAGGYRSLVSLALEVALDESWLPDTRTAAVRLVAGSGAPQQRKALGALRNSVDERMRAELVRGLIPDVLAVDEIVTFVAEGGEHLFNFRLSEAIRQLAVDVLDHVLNAVSPALQSPIDSEPDRRRVDVAMVFLIERLRRAGPQPAGVADSLLMIESRDARGFHDLGLEQRREISELVARDDDLRRGLWTRRLGATTEQLAFGAVSASMFGDHCEADLEWLLRFVDDKEAQYRAADFAWQQILNRLPPERRLALVAGDGSSDALRERVRQAHARRAEHDARDERETTARRQREASAREKDRAAIQPLKADIARGDNLNALTWAWPRLQNGHDLRRGPNLDRLAEAVGEDLVPVFVAGFKACWRKQAVDAPDPAASGRPLKVLAGLVGLILEVTDGLDFGALRNDEAERVATYALYELNGFPEWFEALLAAHPQPVKSVLEKAVTLEWNSDSESVGVLPYAPYSPATISRVLADLALQLLEQRQPRTRAVLARALDAVLLLEHAATRARAVVAAALQAAQIEDAGLALWLRVSAHLAPLEAAQWFEVHIKTHASRARSLFREVVLLLDEDLVERRSRIENSAFMTPASLERWLMLFHTITASSDSSVDSSSSSTGDDATRFRDRCLDVLARDPSLAARAALVRVTKDTSFPNTRYAEHLIATQRSVATEQAAVAWTEYDILAAESRDERSPRTLSELFALVRSHLRDVARVLEDDEFSYRDLFTDAQEREIQLWVASTLRQRARGLYSVVRENVLDDDKEVDITAVADGVGQVPIEIKPIFKLSAPALVAFIKGQLVGRYMTQHDRTCGVFLLVSLKPKKFRIDGQLVGLSGLMKHLQHHTEELGLRIGKEIAIETVTIGRSKDATQSQA